MSERVLPSLDRDDALELLDAATRYDYRLDLTHPAVEALDAATRRARLLDWYSDDAPGPVPDDEIDIQIRAVAPLLVAHGREQERAALMPQREAAENLAVAAEWAGQHIAYAAPELIAEKAVEGIQRLQEPLAEYISLSEKEEA